MPVSAKPVFAALLLHEVPRGALGLVEVVLPPPVGLAQGPVRPEAEVRAIGVALVVELGLLHRILEAAPLDDDPAHDFCG